MWAKHSKRVLLVDDDEETLSLMVNALRRANYDVTSATNGKDALDLAVKTLPNLIILDLVLPDIFGGEVASTLAKSQATAKIPIILLTGYADESKANTRESFGRHCVVTKPIEVEELLKIVAKTIED